MSNQTKESALEPLLVRRRSDPDSDVDRPTLDDILPFPVSGESVYHLVTKETRVKSETTDDS